MVPMGPIGSMGHMGPMENMGKTLRAVRSPKSSAPIRCFPFLRQGHKVRGDDMWRTRAWTAVIIVAAAVMYHRTFAYFWRERREEPQYSLAYLVPFVSGYFLWRQWPRVREAAKSPTPLGLVLIVLALMLHLGGTLLDVSGPSSISVLVFLTGCCLYLHGPRLVRAIAFPLAYLVFAVPVPGGITDEIGFPLQLWASGASASLLEAFGIQVARSGVNLSVPGFDMQVAQACSGMSSLVALTGVAAVFAYMTSLPASQKWALFLLAVPVALAANIIRISTIALVGYTWGESAATGVYHKWSSPILFLAEIMLLFLGNWGFERWNARQTTR